MSVYHDHPVGSLVYGSKGTEFEHVAAVVRGSGGPCRMEGCGGERLSLKWPDGGVTRPCARAVEFDANIKAWRLG